MQVVKPLQLTLGKLNVKEILSKRRILLATSEDQQSFSELEPDDFKPESQGSPAEDSASINISYDHIEGARGKPGFISFHGPARRREDEIIASIPVKNQNNLLWLVGPTVLVASFVFPSLYLRRVLSLVFEDSLLTGR